MTQAPSEQTRDDSQRPGVCFWHTDVETGLSCSRCSRLICAQCLVQAPVGIRCRECGKAQPMPTYDVRPANYTLGIGVAFLLMILGTPAWVVLDNLLLVFGAYGPVSGLMAIAFGFVTGDLVSRTVNRKRSALLAIIACAVVVLAYLVSRLFSPFGFGLMDLLFLGVGAFLAWQRLRP